MGQIDRNGRLLLLPSALPCRPAGNLLIDVVSDQQIERLRFTGHPLLIGRKFERPLAVFVAAEGADHGLADQP